MEIWFEVLFDEEKGVEKGKMSHIFLKAYLERIGYEGPLDISLETLKRIQAAHVFSIPFENLDIHLKVPIRLDQESLFTKLIIKKRGGYCYELNGLLYFILNELGFSPQLCLARLMDEKRNLLSESVHMILLIKLDQEWIVDVGWGDGFVEPFCLDEKEQTQQEKIFRVLPEKEGFILSRKNKEERWVKLSYFTLDKRQLNDFEERNHYHQTCEDSVFMQELICSKPTSTGSITLKGNIFIEKKNKKRIFKDIKTEEEYIYILKHTFGLDLEINLIGRNLIQQNINRPFTGA